MNKSEYKSKYKNHQEALELYFHRLEDMIGVKVSGDVIGLLKLIVMEMTDQTNLIRNNMKEGGSLNDIHNQLSDAYVQMENKP